MTRLSRMTEIARDVRAQLLSYDESARNLTGQCGLASMLIAAEIDDPYVIRTGFYMRVETILHKRGRYPHRHAWCRIGSMIIDATATQFDRRNKAVHVSRFDEDTRYIETASGRDAIDDIMNNWRCCELPAYMKLAKRLRRSCR